MPKWDLLRIQCNSLYLLGFHVHMQVDMHCVIDVVSYKSIVKGSWVLNRIQCFTPPPKKKHSVCGSTKAQGVCSDLWELQSHHWLATWGYQPAYDSSQLGCWHLANKDTGCKVLGESISESCRRYQMRYWHIYVGFFFPLSIPLTLLFSKHLQ